MLIYLLIFKEKLKNLKNFSPDYSKKCAKNEMLKKIGSRTRYLTVIFYSPIAPKNALKLKC